MEMPDLLQKLFFDDVETKRPGKSSPSIRVRHHNRSGVVELVGREPLMFARVESGVTKFSPKKHKTPKWKMLDQKQQFPAGKFNFFAGRRKTTNFRGGGNTSKLARQ